MKKTILVGGVGSVLWIIAKATGLAVRDMLRNAKKVKVKIDHEIRCFNNWFVAFFHFEFGMGGEDGMAGAPVPA
jgi:hypothetical protein